MRGAPKLAATLVGRAQGRRAVQGPRDAAHRRRRRHGRRLGMAAGPTASSPIGASDSDRRDSPQRAEKLAQREGCSSEGVGVSDAVVVEEVKPGITKVTLNRPERLNAMNYALVQGLHDVFDDIAADPVVPRRRAHRRGARVLRRARPHRGCEPADDERHGARAGGHDRAEADRRPGADDARVAAADHRGRQRRRVGRRARARARERRAHRGRVRALQRRVRAHRAVGLRHRRVVAAAATHRRVARVRVAADRPADRRDRSRSHRAGDACRARRHRSSTPRWRPPSSSSATARSACA